MLARFLSTLLIGSSLIPAATAAAAEPPVFGAPITIAQDGADPSVAVGPGGDAVIAWSGRDGGVFVARRGVLGGPFSPPERISDEHARAVRLLRNPAGTLAVVWLGRTVMSQPAHVSAAVAAPGAAFGAPETVALPDRPSGEPAVFMDNVAPVAALSADGSVTVCVTDLDHRLLISTRSPGWSFPPAHVLADQVFNDASIAAPGSGPAVAAWMREPDTDPSHTLTFVAEVGAGPEVPRLLSEPTQLGTNGSSGPTVVANARGDVLVTWLAYARDMFAPTGLEVAERSPSGDWEPTHSLLGARFIGFSLSAAMNDRGAAVVGAYSPVGESNTLMRPDGGAFGPLRTVSLPAGSVAGGGASAALGIDALGDTVQLSLVGGFGTDPAARIVATVHADGVASVLPVSDPGETETVPVVGFDGFGNGVGAWSSPGTGGGAIRVAPYSAAAPVVSALRVGKRELRLRVSEPAVVGVDVRGPHRTRGQQLFLARAGFNRVAFTRKLRKALRRRGRYTVVVRTADAGPRRGVLKLSIRRR